MEIKTENLWCAVHNHDFGVSVYLFYFKPTKNKKYPTEKQLIKRFEIDFEPERDEWIDIIQCDTTDIPTL